MVDLAYFDTKSHPTKTSRSLLEVLPSPNGNIKFGEYIMESVKLNLELGFSNTIKYLSYYDGSSKERTDDYAIPIKKFLETN